MANISKSNSENSKTEKTELGQELITGMKEAVLHSRGKKKLRTNRPVMSRPQLVRMMQRWSVATMCCNCHPHGNYDDCEAECNKACYNTMALRDFMSVSFALMCYIMVEESRLNDTTRRARGGNRTTRSSNRNKGRRT